MREQVYVKFAEAVQQRQLEKQAAALVAAIHAQETKIAEIDRQIEQLQMAKQASIGEGAGLQKMGEFDGAINALYLEKQASKKGLSKLMSQAAKIGLSPAQISRGVKHGTLRQLIDQLASKRSLKKIVGGDAYRSMGLAAPDTGHMLTMQNLREVANNTPKARLLLAAPVEKSFPAAAKAKISVSKLMSGAADTGALGSQGKTFAKRMNRAAKGGTSLVGSATGGSARRTARLGLADEVGTTSRAVVPVSTREVAVGGPGEAKKKGYLGKILAALGLTGAGGAAIYGLSGRPTPPPPPPGMSNTALAALIGGGALAAGGAGAYALSGDDEEEEQK